MIYIIIALLFYTVAIMFATIASRNAETNLVSAIINIMSAIIPVIIIAPLLNRKLFESGKFGIIMAVLAGVCIAIFTMALAKSYATNKVAVVVPIVFGGSIVLSAILSSIFFKEKITLFQTGGLVLMTVGLICIIYARLTGR